MRWITRMTDYLTNFKYLLRFQHSHFRMQFHEKGVWILLLAASIRNLWISLTLSGVCEFQLNSKDQQHYTCLDTYFHFVWCGFTGPSCLNLGSQNSGMVCIKKSISNAFKKYRKTISSPDHTWRHFGDRTVLRLNEQWIAVSHPQSLVENIISSLPSNVELDCKNDRHTSCCLKKISRSIFNKSCKNPFWWKN